MKQGEIWELFLGPIKGSEQGGRRLALIISGNAINDNLNIVIVCPLTSKIKEFKGNLIINPSAKNGLKKVSEVLTFHIRSVAKERLKNKLGNIPLKDIESIKKTLGDLLKY